jgi:hypothetical protein
MSILIKPAYAVLAILLLALLALSSCSKPDYDSLPYTEMEAAKDAGAVK